MRTKHLILAGAGPLLAAAIAGSVAYATIPSDTNVYTACMLKGVGMRRYDHQRNQRQRWRTLSTEQPSLRRTCWTSWAEGRGRR